MEDTKFKPTPLTPEEQKESNAAAQEFADALNRHVEKQETEKSA